MEELIFIVAARKLHENVKDLTHFSELLLISCIIFENNITPPLFFMKNEAQYMLSICLIFANFEDSYAYRLYAYKKKRVAQILAVKGVAGGLSESVKKAKFVTKIFFSDNVECSSKYLLKMIFADVKSNTSI